MLDTLSALSPLVLVAAFALGYGLGSIPFGLVVTRLAGAGDIRKIGSGNIGMTNVLRTGRKDLAALTLLGDAGKGWLAVVLAGWLAVRLHTQLSLTGGGSLSEGYRLLGATEAAAMVVAALAAFIGHCYPVWLRFRGGKGVATYLGILLAFSGWAGLGFALTWIATAAVTRFSSLAALVATLVSPLILLAFGRPGVAVLFGLLTAVLYLKHRDNIRRLLAGTESRIGAK